MDVLNFNSMVNHILYRLLVRRKTILSKRSAYISNDSLLYIIYTVFDYCYLFFFKHSYQKIILIIKFKFS